MPGAKMKYFAHFLQTGRMRAASVQIDTYPDGAMI